MKRGALPIQDHLHKVPNDFLQKFVELFGGRGWLNQSFRIVHRNRKYRVFCSESQFIAHRITDPGDIPWGFPCWVVCLVTPEQIIEEPDLSAFAAAEPSVHDWLRFLSEGDFKIL